MLPQRHRQLKSEDIKLLFEDPHTRSTNAYLRVHTRVTEYETPSQFVVIVSRKVHKSAVKRNMIRRQLYSILSRLFSEWTAGLRVAILVKPSFLKLSRTERLQIFLDTLHGADLL